MYMILFICIIISHFAVQCVSSTDRLLSAVERQCRLHIKLRVDIRSGSSATGFKRAG